MTPSQDSRTLYLDLMKKCLTYFLWDEDFEVVKPIPGQHLIKRFLVKLFIARLERLNIRLLHSIPFDAKIRLEGKDQPIFAHTMIGLKRLDNIQFCVEDVLRNNIPGDLIETGVWRGGATIFMRAILRAYQVTDRIVWVADSFMGLPKPDAEKYPADKDDQHHLMDNLAISLDQVKANFSRYDLLDEQVQFLQGWFKDTLPNAPISNLSVIRLDGDMYESTMDALQHLYPKLSVGGYVIIDDFGYIESCKQAVLDYRAKIGITEEIIPIDWTGVYWRKLEG